MKILITNPLSRKTFDVVNILLRHYDLEDLIFLSDTAQKRIKYIYSLERCYDTGNKAFENVLLSISKKHEDQNIIFLPIEEETIILFSRFIDKYGVLNFKFSLPPFDSFNLSRNKDKLNIFCENYAIPSPKFYTEDNYNFPLIIKPINGSGAEGIKFIKSIEELNLEKINFRKYFIQELLPNPKDILAGFYLCEGGAVLSFYSHKRIRTFPKNGGVSVFSKSGEDFAIKRAGEKIIRHLKWNGLLMIEFIKDERSDELKLIEINPRIWGSVILSEFNGANFIKSYIDLSLGVPLQNVKIRDDVFIRWVFPYDFLYLFENPSQFFKKHRNTCYLNFTYSTYLRSIRFIGLTYFKLKKIITLLNEK